MNQPRSGLLTLLVMGALLCLSVSGLGTKFSAAHAANSTLYEITGTVEALDAKTDPPVILLKSLSKTKEELVVGAVIKQGAMITRGTLHVRHAGDGAGGSGDRNHEIPEAHRPSGCRPAASTIVCDHL